MRPELESGVALRIVVVGVPRSGTTLVQSLLAAHTTVTSFTESHFFSRHFTLLPLLSTPILTKSPVTRLREFLAENDEPATEAALWLEANVATITRLPFQTRPVARTLLQVLDELTERRGKSSWIEKTPRHLRYVPFLQTISPRTRFVHVIRNGLDVVASLREASQSWERPYDLEACARRWNRDVRFSLGRVNAPTDHFVFYEELTSEPEATLEQLLGALGLDWEPDILERYGRTADSLVTQKEAWKQGVGRSIRPSGASQKSLSAEQRDQVARSLRGDLYDEIFESTRRTSGDP